MYCIGTWTYWCLSLLTRSLFLSKGTVYSCFIQILCLFRARAMVAKLMLSTSWNTRLFCTILAWISLSFIALSAMTHPTMACSWSSLSCFFLLQEQGSRCVLNRNKNIKIHICICICWGQAILLSYLLLHIRNIFFGFSDCDGWLKEFGICFPYLYFCETGSHGWIVSCL